MLGEECLADGGPSDALESTTDVAAKKKKSFHPLRSLKRFFGGNSHGVNSRRRSNNDDVAESSSVLLKAKSTTDVIVSADTTDETEGAFQRASKQISLSADSIFSTERTCDSNLPVSAISSETLLRSEHCGAKSLLQRKDDDEGLPQSPCNLATTAALFIEYGLEEDQSEKWPSFDSGHSLLSVDSNENEAEEDFFKEKWVAISKSSTVNAGNETPAADGSLRDDLDLNHVQRHVSLISSAAIHRLAVRPKGKRGVSTYQQKLGVTSPKLVSGTSLTLVKEESGPSKETQNSDSLGILKTQEKFISAILQAEQKPEKEDSTRVSCDAEVSVKGNEKSSSASTAKKVNTVHSLEKVGLTRSNATDDVTKRFEKTDMKKGGENVASVKSAETIVINKGVEDVGQGETVVLPKEDLKRETLSSSMESNADTAEESSEPVPSRTESEASLNPAPAKQIIVPLSVVVVRQKPPRAVAPSAQEIQEMAARRQTLTFSGESGAGVEKPVSKRSSMVIPDRPLIPAETGNTELAQMFSKFQRRSSQKKQSGTEDPKQLEDDGINGRVNENASQAATDSKPGFAQTASKEQVSLAKAVSGVKRSGKVVGVSSQGAGDSAVGQTSTNQQMKMTDSVKSAEKKSEKSPERNDVNTSRGSEKKEDKVTEKNVDKTAEKSKEKIVEKAAEKSTGKNVEKMVEKNVEKTMEKNVEKTSEKNREKNIERAVKMTAETTTEMNKERKRDKTTEKNKEKSIEKTTETNPEKATEKNRERGTELKIVAADQKEAGVILNKSDTVKNTSTPLALSDEKAKGVKKSYSISYKTTKNQAEKSQPQGMSASVKMRSSSQSDPMDGGGAEAPTRTPLSLTSRRGSFTYSHKGDGRARASPAPCSEVCARTESGAATTSDSSGRTADIQYKPPSIATPTRPQARPGMVLSSPVTAATGSRVVPSGSGSVPAETETVPSGCGTVPLGSGMASSKAVTTPVPLGPRVNPRVIVGPGAVRPPGMGAATPKESVVPSAPQAVPTSDRSVKEAKGSEKSSHQASSSKAGDTPTNREAAQPAPKATPGIRPSGGQRIPTAKEGENLVEWVGVARQKTRAWKEGKIDIAEKMESCN